MRLQMIKPVDLTIQFKLPLGAKVTKASILPNGDIVLLDEKGNEVIPVYMDRTLQYSRKKGPKVQNRRKLQGQYTSVNGLKELACFDSIFVIDTNTKQIGGNVISVACFVCCWIRPHGNDYRVECEPRLNIYEFHNVTGSPELLGMLKVANDVIRSDGCPTERCFAIVTDAHLGAHDAINARHASLYGSHILPAGFQLIYASSDTGREVLNGIIRFCDQQASRYLQLYEDGGLPRRELTQLPEDPTVVYTHVFRNDLEIDNPVISGLRLQEGTKVSLYGIR